MLDEIVLKIILTVVGTVVAGIAGYLVAKIKYYKQKIINKEENEKKQNK